MKCEECEEIIVNHWGFQVIRGARVECHYFCSQEHAEITLAKPPFKDWKVIDSKITA